MEEFEEFLESTDYFLEFQRCVCYLVLRSFSVVVLLRRMDSEATSQSSKGELGWVFDVGRVAQYIQNTRERLHY